MNENIYRILGIQSREDCVSNALAYAFNASDSFRSAFLKQMCGKDLGGYRSTRAYTRVSIGVQGVPDIILVLENESVGDLVVIENKLKAEEGYDQTTRYASTEAVSSMSKRLLPGKGLGQAFFIFLTLFPDQMPVAGNQYIVRRHSALKSIAAGISDWGSPLAEQLVKDWVSLTDKFYEREEVSPEDRFFERLSDDSGLDGGYLYFRYAVAKLNLPDGLDIEDFFRSSQQGRRYYGAVISKDIWHPEEMTRSSGSGLLDPCRHFNIHFEPQYNVVSGIFSFFLHYEVNPYETEAWVRANVSKDQYDSYLARRAAFSQKLQTKRLPGWSFSGGSNQLAKATFDFSKSFYGDVKSTLEEALVVTSQAIDSVLREM